MKESAYGQAIKLLTKRDYSRFKLSQKLSEKGFTPEEIELAIEELLAKKYLREDYYLEARIKGMIRKNYGKHYIISKLATEQLDCPEELLNEIYQELQITPEQQITTLIAKKMRLLKLSLSNSEKEQKLLTLLHSKGHDLEMCRPLIQEVLNS